MSGIIYFHRNRKLRAPKFKNNFPYYDLGPSFIYRRCFLCMKFWCWYPVAMSNTQNKGFMYQFMTTLWFSSHAVHDDNSQCFLLNRLAFSRPSWSLLKLSTWYHIPMVFLCFDNIIKSNKRTWIFENIFSPNQVNRSTSPWKYFLGMGQEYLYRKSYPKLKHVQ